MPLTTAFLGLGSNMGDRLAHLRAALHALEARGAVLVVRSSRAYVNRAVGMGEAGDFLNAVVEVKTGRSPEALLEACLEVEGALGRVRGNNAGWMPRTIDIDLLAYGGESRSTDRLCLPHPRIAERDFVVGPLLDLDPQLKFSGRSVRSMAGDLSIGALSPIGEPLWPDARINVIAACASNRVIGRDGKLPWSIPEDWEVFLKKTLGGTLIMGRISFFGMMREPGWREGRDYVVVTSRPEAVEQFGATAVDSFAAAVARAEEQNKPVWICGGAGVYAEAFPLADRLHLTEIHANFEGDTFFPEWRECFPDETARIESGDGQYRYSFTVCQ